MRSCTRCSGMGWTPYVGPPLTGLAELELRLTGFKEPCYRCQGAGEFIRKTWIAACERLRLYQAIEDVQKQREHDTLSRLSEYTKRYGISR